MFKNIGIPIAVALAALACALAGCEKEQTAGPQFAATTSGSGKEYVFAIHPLHNPVRLFEAVNSSRLPAQIQPDLQSPE